MTVLAVDTALGSCSTALTDASGRPLAHRFERRRRGHSEVLPAAVEAVLAEAGCHRSALAGLATTVGPGTFTGLRVGLSFARGLALSAGLPVRGITTLAAVAADAAANADAPRSQSLLIALSTKRQDYYLQLFASDGQTAVSTPAALLPTDVPDWLDQLGPIQPASLVMAGDAASDLAAAVPALATAAIAATPTGGLPQAATVAALAAEAGLPPAGTPPPAPVYLRAPDVTPPP